MQFQIDVAKLICKSYSTYLSKKYTLSHILKQISIMVLIQQSAKRIILLMLSKENMLTRLRKRQGGKSDKINPRPLKTMS